MQASIKLFKFALIFGLCLGSLHAYAGSSRSALSPVSPVTKSGPSAPAGKAGPTAAEVAETERTVRDLMELDHFKDIGYRDEHGAVITSNEFYKRVTTGQSFATAKLPGGNNSTSAVLSLMAKEVPPETQVTTATYKIKRGDKFPNFRLPQLDGHVVDNKQLAGRYTVVNFYFAWCGPCVKEVPDLNTMQARHQDMNFVAMTFDSTDDAKQFVADRNFEWKVLPDAKKFIGQIGVHAYPSFALLDPHGVVLGITGGSAMIASDNSLENWAARLMAMPILK